MTRKAGALSLSINIRPMKPPTPFVQKLIRIGTSIEQWNPYPLPSGWNGPGFKVEGSLTWRDISEICLSPAYLRISTTMEGWLLGPKKEEWTYAFDEINNLYTGRTFGLSSVGCSAFEITLPKAEQEIFYFTLAHLSTIAHVSVSGNIPYMRNGVSRGAVLTAKADNLYDNQGYPMIAPFQEYSSNFINSLS